MNYYVVNGSRLFAGPFVIWAYAQMVATQHGYQVISEEEMELRIQTAKTGV